MSGGMVIAWLYITLWIHMDFSLQGCFSKKYMNQAVREKMPKRGPVSPYFVFNTKSRHKIRLNQCILPSDDRVNPRSSGHGYILNYQRKGMEL